MRRSQAMGCLFGILAAMTAFTVALGADKPASPAILVKVLTKDMHSYVGELKSETDADLVMIDLMTGHDRTIDKDNIRHLDRDLSDDAAIAATDLPSVLIWKMGKLKLDDGPITGKIAQVSDDVIYTTLGGNRVSVGSHVTVYRDEGTIKDPDTGKVLGVERPRLGELEITEVQDNFSKAKRLGDVEIKLQAGDVVEEPGQKLRIAVYPPVDDNGVFTSPAIALAEKLTTRLVNANFDVLERARLDAALVELVIQNTDLFDPATAQKFGKQVGATYVLTGRVVSGGSSPQAHMRLIDVQTGKICLAASAPLPGGGSGGAAGPADSSSPSAAGGSARPAGSPTILRASLPSSMTCNRSFSPVKDGLSLPPGTYIRTKDGGFTDKDFVFDVWFRFDHRLDNSTLIGIGSGIDGEHATPVNSIFLSVRNHDGEITMMDREGYGGKKIGSETDEGEYVARIQKEGSSVTFSIGAEKDGKFSADCSDAYADIQSTPDDFNERNMHLFFGAGTFSKFRLTTGRIAAAASSDDATPTPDAVAAAKMPADRPPAVILPIAKPAAGTPTTPAAAELPPSAPAATSAVVKVKYASGDAEFDTLKNGVKFFTGSRYTLTELPGELVGLTFARRGTRSKGAVTIDCPAGSTVYALADMGTDAQLARPDHANFDQNMASSGWVRVDGVAMTPDKAHHLIIYKMALSQPKHLVISEIKDDHSSIHSGSITVASANLQQSSAAGK